MADERQKDKKWGKEDDAKLASLFRKGASHQGVSSTNLSADAIKAVNDKHFKRDNKNFAPLFRSKARAWNIDQTLIGARSKFMFVICHT
jgi:hypothetical protein